MLEIRSVGCFDGMSQTFTLTLTQSASAKNDIAFVLQLDPNGEPRIDKLFKLAQAAGMGETISHEAIAEILTRCGLSLQ